MAATANAAQLLLDATSPRIVPVSLPTNVSLPTTQVTGLGGLALLNTADWSSNVSGAGKPSNGADVTATILGASGTSIVMTNANLFKSGSGLGGVFIGSAGLYGKNSSGVTTFSIDGTTGAAVFKGDISGGANIDITGNAKFGGAVTIGSFTYAGLFNASGGAQGGLKAFGSTGSGVWGSNTGSGNGVYGEANSGIGVDGSSASGIGVHAYSATGVALKCNGTMEKVGTGVVGNLNAELWNGLEFITMNTGGATGTYVSSNKPGSSTSNIWLVLRLGAGDYCIPIWAL